MFTFKDIQNDTALFEKAVSHSAKSLFAHGRSAADLGHASCRSIVGARCSHPADSTLAETQAHIAATRQCAPER